MSRNADTCPMLMAPHEAGGMHFRRCRVLESFLGTMPIILRQACIECCKHENTTNPITNAFIDRDLHNRIICGDAEFPVCKKVSIKQTIAKMRARGFADRKIYGALSLSASKGYMTPQRATEIMIEEHVQTQ